MKKLPHEAEVRRALQSAALAVRRAQKGANQVAGQALARGRYDEAQALTERARRVQEFGQALDALRKQWKEVRRPGPAGGPKERAAKTPQWAFFQPILKALVEAGGAATRRELEPEVERIMADQLKPGDREVLAGGRQRWQKMLGWSRKHLAAEGWIEKGVRPTWEITSSGKKAAAKTITKAPTGE